MKPDLPPAVATAAEAEWINGELIRGLMRTARSTRLVGLLLVPLLVAAGAAPDATPTTVLDGGIRHGMLAMESYLFGQTVTLQALEPAHA